MFKPNCNLTQTVAAKKAILFDLFHTLTSIETTPGNNRPFTHQILRVSKEAWEEQLHKHSRERLTGEKKDPLVIVAERAHAIDPSIPEDMIREATENRIARFATALTRIPDEAVRVLRTLKSRGKQIGLVSNSDAMEVKAWEQSPIVGLFDSAVFSCFVGCVKPEPAIYHIAMGELEVVPTETLFVGDGGSKELEGARSLGITTVMFTGIIKQFWPERIPGQRPYADFIIETLFDLVM